MNRRTALSALAAPLALGAASSAHAAAGGPQLAHMVFFATKDRSEEGRKAFVALCEKFLSGHPGVAYFSVGTIAEDSVEPNVSVRDFDVALHVVFDNKAAKEAYLKSQRHDQFVASIQGLVGTVRVFDSYIATK